LVAPSGCLSVCATRFRPWVWPAVRRFVPARRGSSRARRKPSGPCRPARLLLGFQAGSPAFVFGPVGGSNSAGWFWRAKNPFAPRGFGLGPGPQCAGLFQPRRGSSRARRKPGGVPSSRPDSVRESGWAARFRFLARSGVPTPPAGFGPTRRSRGRGVMLWPVFPEFRPPAPLSLGVGRVQERAGARRAGRSAGKLWAAVVPPGLAGLPFGLSRNWAVPQVLAFWSAGGQA
jgi:hypothetical protein